ncbi:hypothetical protein ALQ64_00219 [Pseudomonas cannabina]|uniref:Uncharacterized protein n=1 Tax=Pseudomonas cannabina TaxID=86840 RepID=A0A3M3KMY7_PSECA|nr:hypothetical protein [Pseudomonas cannabina]RMN23973.1 hypothetical protein ALQ64_00219 [Pseudomonas cannabina]
MADPIKHHFRLKRPCKNCPFLQKGAIELAPGRLDGIIAGLIEDDHSTFQCHVTVHSSRGGEWTEDGSYKPSGHESMCAGAAGYLMKHKRPTVGMRIAFVTGAASPSDWDDVLALIIE